MPSFPSSPADLTPPKRSPIPDDRPSLKGLEKLLVFDCDYNSYHLGFIRAGVQSYFNQGKRTLSYVHFGTNDLFEFFGASVADRLVSIGCFRSPESLEFFRSRNIPCLNLFEGAHHSPLGFDIHFEDEGVLAAKHFISEMGLSHLGFIGYAAGVKHARRLREFTWEAERSGLPVKAMHLPITFAQRRFSEVPTEEVQSNGKSIREFLSSIRKPAGIFCTDDNIALRVYYAAELLGIRVPDELAILGVGSRDSAKELWARAVSVVQIDHHRIGYLGAKLLDEFVATDKAPKPVRLKPSGISHSQTTFHRAVSDPVVRKALVLIQQDPSLTVTSICDKLGLGRTTLDSHFRDSANMSLAKAIEIERFNHAMQLIKTHDYNLESIAALSGYSNSRTMRRSFQRFTRMTPQQFREMGQSAR
jgi:LacI family transcriptional regulator